MQIIITEGYLVYRGGVPVAWPNTEIEAQEAAINEAMTHPGEIISLQQPTLQFLQDKDNDLTVNEVFKVPA
jgi:hypothetical protein